MCLSCSTPQFPIVEKLYRGVNGGSFNIEYSREIDRDYAEALWKGCRFTIEP
jgi:hypothetical protein